TLGSCATVSRPQGRLGADWSLRMTTTAARAASIRPVRTSLTRIVAAGLAGGAVDFVYASTMGVLAGRGVARVWQGVAAGWLGEPAFEGGAATAPLGIVTHFAIA